MENTDKENQVIPPLLECKLELQAPDMIFDPSLEQVCPIMLSYAYILLCVTSLRILVYSVHVAPLEKGEDVCV